ncbi:hypothetical protein KCP78_12985 [Salmonella enterica subsp. enterica]|nr:hypothetical protein KCP78_12985 [Salmonella enterica subsp. enterica]
MSPSLAPLAELPYAATPALSQRHNVSDGWRPVRCRRCPPQDIINRQAVGKPAKLTDFFNKVTTSTDSAR